MLPQLVPPPQTDVVGTARASLDLERKAREIVSHLKTWAEASPELSDVLLDCVEEISWVARLKPSRVPAQSVDSPILKQGVKELLTTLHLWAQLYYPFSRVLLSCVDELEAVAPRTNGEADKDRRARDIVIEALSAGYQTSAQIAALKGLQPRRVRRALMRLVQLKLVRVVGCGALTPADGNRTRLYALTHTHVC